MYLSTYPPKYLGKEKAQNMKLESLARSGNW